MKMTVLIDGYAPVIANLNDDVKIEHGSGLFKITATYPTYGIDELLRRVSTGEHVAPVEVQR